MNPIYNKESLENSRLRHSVKMWKVGFIIILLSSVVIVFLAIIQMNDLKIHNDSLRKAVNTLSQENQNIQRKNSMSERLLNGSKAENRRLVHENRKLKNRTYSSNKQTTNSYSKPKINYTNRTYTPTTNYTPKIKPTQRTYAKQRATTNTKQYQNFSSNIKLESTSKISKNSDNRLRSNAVIYGIYYGKNPSYLNPNKNQIANIKCGLKKHRYKTIDECSMEVGNELDKVYLSAMNAKYIKDFNLKTHRIECTYSKEHGIMHSCKKERFKFN